MNVFAFFFLVTGAELQNKDPTSREPNYSIIKDRENYLHIQKKYLLKIKI